MSETVSQQRSQFIMLFFAFSFGMILSNLIGQNQAKTEPVEQEILITYRGIDKTIEDLPEDKAKEFDLMLKKSDKEQREFLSAIALSWGVNEFMQTKKLSAAEASRKFFSIQEPNEEDVSQFYEREKLSISKPYYEVKDDISLHLLSLRAKEARKQKLEKMIEKGDLAIFPDRPNKTLPDGA